MQACRVIACGRALIAAIGALALSGCAATSGVPRRDVGATVGNQGGAWEVTFAAAGSDAAGVEPGPEYERRDGTLFTHADEGSDLPDAWPSDGRQSLDDVRYIYLPRNARDVTYFGRNWSRGPRSYGW